MISLFWLAAGGVGAWTVKTIAEGAREKENNENEDGNSEKKSDQNCYNCRSFDRNAWASRHMDRDGNEVAADMDTYKVYCPNTCKEYRINSRDDVKNKMLCGKEYNHRYR